MIIIQASAVQDERGIIRTSHDHRILAPNDRVRCSKKFRFLFDEEDDQTPIQQLLDVVFEQPQTVHGIHIQRSIPYYAHTPFNIKNGPTNKIEYRLCEDDILQDFINGVEKKPLALMFPLNGKSPPPVEYLDKVSRANKKKKETRKNPYAEPHIIQDWTDKILSKLTG